MKKFFDFIKESKDNSELISMIRRDCNPYLEDISETGKCLYRGSGYFTSNYIKLSTLKDREPINMDKQIHHLLDDEFNNQFGVRPRSEGVFTTSSLEDSKIYGTQCYFFPVGEYKFIWSKKISDLYHTVDSKIKDMDLPTTVIRDDSGRFTTELNFKRMTNDNRRSLVKMSMEIVDDYIDYDIVGALDSSNEVVIICDSYYLVKVNDSGLSIQDFIYE